jgi:enoyl-CoA hydratase/carnithine racemase
MTSVATERRDAVLWIRLCRPELRNALSQDEVDRLTGAIAEAGTDPLVGAVVITGTGEAFSAGGDLHAMRDLDMDGMRRLVASGQALMRSIETLERPVVAAINGWALGGGLELALACDVRIASDHAVLGLPELSLGTVPGWGGTHRLTAAIGGARAAHHLLVPDRIGAREALALGLVTALHPPGELEPAAQRLGERLAALQPHVVAGAKRALLAARRGAADAASAAELDAVLDCRAHGVPARAAVEGGR